VHFLRFEFGQDMVKAAKQGTAIAIGIDHPAYQVTISELAPASREALVADFA
jgi:hypothetical protein